MGLLHHVCDDHEWIGGQCDHGDLDPEEQHPPWFDRRDKDFAALQKVILEPTLLESLKYYVRFRYGKKSQICPFNIVKCKENFNVN